MRSFNKQRYLPLKPDGQNPQWKENQLLQVVLCPPFMPHGIYTLTYV